LTGDTGNRSSCSEQFYGYGHVQFSFDSLHESSTSRFSKNWAVQVRSSTSSFGHLELFHDNSSGQEGKTWQG